MRIRDDSIEETSIGSPGTGNILLGGATDGNRAFSVIGGGNECYYRAETSDLSAWEIGSATYNSGANSLTRDEIFVNSLGTTAKVNLTSGCTVYLTLLAREITAGAALLPLCTGELTAEGGPVLIADPFGQCIGVPVA
jgi:hypothetical protein